MFLSGAGRPHYPTEHQPHQHVARFLVLHKGVSHLIVPLENMYRAAHEFSVEALLHYFRSVIAQNLDPSFVIQNGFIDRLKADVILLGEVRAMARVECIDNFRKCPLLGVVAELSR